MQGPKLPRRDALKTLAGLGSLAVLRAENAPEAALNRRDQLFDFGWRFLRGDAPGAEQPGFDDSGWRTLDLPHDYSIEDLPPRPESTGESAVWSDCGCPSRIGPFDRDLSENRQSTGWVVGGTGWYRKRFSAAGLAPDRHLEIRFDGVYMDADVWLNGHHLGGHPYGYTGFAYDLTAFLRRDAANVLAVRVRNEGRNSRWYSGSGIYRHVWLTATGELRVPLWGVRVTTPEVSRDAATVKVAVKVENRGQGTASAKVRIRLLDPDGAPVASREVAATLAARAEGEVEEAFQLAAPKLWSTASPRLYKAEVEILAAGASPVTDAGLAAGGGMARASGFATFGIRKIEVDAERGLRINGEVVKLKGACLHHDNGVLGAAAFDRAEERRVEIMKANGFNALRCSHNPPSPAFLDACDRLGMLVIDEAFDMWEEPKNPQDYHRFFKAGWQRDLDAMVLRDRNHPCVLFWSIGNEIKERADPRGVAIAKELADEVRRLDPTRPVTAAICAFWEFKEKRPWTDSDPAFQYLDVGGYNYEWKQYESDHARFPKRVIAGTESFAMEAFENWSLVEKLPYVIGDFVWTGMDYLGEAGIGHSRLKGSASGVLAGFPWFNAYCGDIDLIGGKKPQSYYRDVVWGNSKLEMAVQRPLPDGAVEELSRWGWSDELRSWTWPGCEAKPLKVRVYSAGDHVRLLVNGKEIASKPVSPETKLKAEFDVPYAPGELRAIAMKDGKEIASLAFKTAGAPAKLRIRADRQALRASRHDLAFVTVEVLDEGSNPVPDAVVPVTFRIGGVAELAGIGNASPKDMASFRRPRRKTFQGKCLAVLRSTGRAGAITVRAEAEGLMPAGIVLHAR